MEIHFQTRVQDGYQYVPYLVAEFSTIKLTRLPVLASLLFSSSFTFSTILEL
jgi:hypothetical protein